MAKIASALFATKLYIIIYKFFYLLFLFLLYFFFFFFFIFLTYFIKKLVFISFKCKLWLIFTFDQLEINE